MKSLEIALHCAEAAEDKKATDILILDMRPLTSISDYFLICAATSDRQVRAIANEIQKKLKEKGLHCFHVEGMREGKWVVIDFFDVLVHVFSEETRKFYQLERLWGDAHKVLPPKPVRKQSAKRKKSSQK